MIEEGGPQLRPGEFVKVREDAFGEKRGRRKREGRREYPPWGTKGKDPGKWEQGGAPVGGGKCTSKKGKCLKKGGHRPRRRCQ